MRDVKLSGIAAAALLVMLDAEAQADDQPHLNALHIEPHPAGGVLAVSTNSYILSVVHDKDGYSNGRWCCPVNDKLRRAVFADWPKPAQGLTMAGDWVFYRDVPYRIPVLDSSELLWRSRLASFTLGKSPSTVISNRFLKRLAQFQTPLLTDEAPNGTVIYAGDFGGVSLVYFERTALPAFAILGPYSVEGDVASVDHWRRVLGQA